MPSVYVRSKQVAKCLQQAGWRGDLAAMLLGLSGPLAFSPFNLFWVPIVLLALLLTLLTELTSQQMARRAFLAGLGFFSFGISAVYYSIHDYGHAGVALSLLMTGLFAVYLASFWGLFGWLLGRFLNLSRAFDVLLVVPTLWVLVEYFRGVFLSGFPWLFLGYSQLNSPLSGWVPVVGVMGVSWLLCFSAVIVYWLLHRRQACPAVTMTIIGIGLTCWLGGAALLFVRWTQPVGELIQVSLVQANTAQEDKWRVNKREKIIEQHLKLTQQHYDSDLIVWSENALPAFYHQMRPLLAALDLEAKKNQTEVLLGLQLWEKKTRRYYNSMVSVGGMPNQYKKRHLLMFGEYVPLEKWLRGVIEFFNLPMSSFSAGSANQPLLHLAGHPVGVAICYEIAFPWELNQYFPNSHFLVHVSNDTWFGNSIGPWQHLEQARMRALEYGRPLVRATNNGITAVINDTGAVVKVVPQFQTVVLTEHIQPMTGKTPYARMGHWLLNVFLMVTLVLFGIRQWLEARRNVE